jgi:hypothetical protein
MPTHESLDQPLAGRPGDDLSAALPAVRARLGFRPRMIRHAWVQAAAATAPGAVGRPLQAGSEPAIDDRRAA